MKNLILLVGLQADSFLLLHPIKCGLYRDRLVQLQDWVKAYDKLVALSASVNFKPFNLPDIDTIGEFNYFDRFMDHAVSIDNSLVLVRDGNRYIIESNDVDFFHVRLETQNGTSWIDQGATWLFNRSRPFTMLDLLLTAWLSDDLSYLSGYSDYVIK